MNTHIYPLIFFNWINIQTFLLIFVFFSSIILMFLASVPILSEEITPCGVKHGTVSVSTFVVKHGLVLPCLVVIVKCRILLTVLLTDVIPDCLAYPGRHLSTFVRMGNRCIAIVVDFIVFLQQWLQELQSLKKQMLVSVFGSIRCFIAMPLFIRIRLVCLERVGIKEWCSHLLVFILHQWDCFPGNHWSFHCLDQFPDHIAHRGIAS